MVTKIPFNVPYVPTISRHYVTEALSSEHQQGDGPFTKKASRMVSDLVGGGHVLLTPSCTHALEMASMLANLGPGDEVILPSYTFTSAATAVTKFGATPVFVDIEMDTKGIDVNQAREAITPKTKAISWVNYAGVAPDIAGLKSLANDFGLLLIEDNAHGFGAQYSGQALGSFGDFATQSFHSTKNVQCGEGGALVINNTKFIERAEIIREKGTNRSRFVRGESKKYHWIDHGSSYLLAETLSAILLGQLESFDLIQSQRSSVTQNYFEAVSKSNLYEGVLLKPENLTSITSTAHMFFLEFLDLELREIVLNSLRGEQIQVSSHYVPLDSSPAGLRYGRTPFVCSNSDFFSRSILRLPVHHNIGASEVDLIVREILTRVEN